MIAIESMVILDVDHPSLRNTPHVDQLTIAQSHFSVLSALSSLRPVITWSIMGLANLLISRHKDDHLSVA
jgi:hypothetical protein